MDLGSDFGLVPALEYNIIVAWMLGMNITAFDQFDQIKSKNLDKKEKVWIFGKFGNLLTFGNSGCFWNFCKFENFGTFENFGNFGNSMKFGNSADFENSGIFGSFGIL